MLLQNQQPEDLTLLEKIGGYLTSGEFWFQTLVMVGLAPIWFPILKALYREIDRSLRDQGGIFGRSYTPIELKRLAEKDDPGGEMPLRSIPHGPRAERGTGRSPAAPRPTNAGGAARGGGGRAGRPLRSSRPRGF